MKITIITVVLNAADTIGDTLRSISAQTAPPHQHLIVDGGSTDGTLEIIKEHLGHPITLVSEPDDGLYDAMNRGLRRATGDVIGFLNADDMYASNLVLARIASSFKSANVDACYADLVYVDQFDTKKVVRNWISQPYQPGLSFKGWMPAHPTFYMTRSGYQKVGEFDTSLKYQADLEFCARAFEVHHINTLYIPELWVRMRLGGVTNNSILAMVKGNWESYAALRRLGMRRDPVSYFVIKFSSRLKQFFQTTYN